MTVKVLVIDDSIFIRKVLSDIISADSRFELVGTAVNGKEGLEKIKNLNPDVITLDVEMPIMNGLEMLAILMTSNPKPVILLSSLTKKGAKETIHALELGAIDFITKPEGIFAKNLPTVERELKEKLLVAGSAKPGSFRRKTIVHGKQEDYDLKTMASTAKTLTAKASRADILVIGASTGGPSALSHVINSLPERVNVPILIVQHMPVGFTKLLADRLNNSSRLVVKEAKDNELLLPGQVYIAPAGHQVNLKSTGTELLFKLTDKSPFETLFKPSIDLLMLEAVRVFNSKVLAVVLTGMGNDGLRGAKAIKSAGGKVLVESEETCVVYGMPRVIVEAGLADEILPLSSISSGIIRNLGV